MSLGRFLLKLVINIGLISILYFSLNTFAPYRSNQSLDLGIILLVVAVFALFVFFFVQTIALSLRVSSRTSNRLAFLSSIVLVQLGLLNSASFFNWGAILLIMVLNLVLIVSLMKVL